VTAAYDKTAVVLTGRAPEREREREREREYLSVCVREKESARERERARARARERERERKREIRCGGRRDNFFPACSLSSLEEFGLVGEGGRRREEIHRWRQRDKHR
jgi:hypothetical protein